MTLHDFLLSRRSVRRFKPDPIPDSVIERILTTATYAPSAHNLQPWRFVVIKNPDVKPRLAKTLTDKMRLDIQAEGAAETEIDKRIANSLRRIDEAPVIIILCRDTIDVRINTPEETIMNIQSTALAGLQLLLAAHAEGLGANWICWPLYATKETQSVLELPENWEPQAMIIVGFANEQSKQKELKPLNTISIYL
jgi:coenzyme F420-0:L-glutamate ligase / coenzyme F420-1:gamma-L-glutamate ligase